MVVCDVQKESNQIMQELNDAQVNLIHVAATCKNAADEKLKQSIRRFADIHGSPAAIILISGDINFAADLSDLRHRKKIHIILLHKSNTSKALILCANEHYDFMSLAKPLPSRTPSKVSESCDLLVCNLPEDKDVVIIKRRLKQLSENCGGRVLEIQSSTAIIRFTTEISADRAQKRMEGADVLGSKITVRSRKDKVNSCNKSQGIRNRASSESEILASSSRQMYGASASIAGARTLQVPYYQSSSPVVGNYSSWNGVRCTAVNPSGMIQPPPIFCGRSYVNSNDSSFSRSYNEARAQSPAVWQSQQLGCMWEEQYKSEKNKVSGKRLQSSQARDNISYGARSRTPEDFKKVRIVHSSFTHSSERPNSRQCYSSLAAPSNCNGNAFVQQNLFKRRSPSPLYGARDRDQWNGQKQSIAPHNNRTVSPYGNNSAQTMSQNSHITSFNPSDAENEEIEKFFNPINSRVLSNSSNSTYSPIELQVTNLDQNIEPKEMKRILSSVFMEHVTVLHVSVFIQSDGNVAASVKVPSLPDAQYAISQLHRSKIGYRRILISYAHTGGPNPQLIRAQIVMLLQEVPGHKLPLFKFREMYESRFMISISVSELYKMKDVCSITEDPNGRMVSLNPDHRNTPSPCFNNPAQEGHIELPYCTVHTPKPWSDKGWAEQEMASLPNVRISLKILTPRIHQLLSTHYGSLPLPSLPHCYEAEFNEKLPVIEEGVPLEHLVSCMPSIELRQGSGSVKHIYWSDKKNSDDSHEDNKCVSPPLANQLALFSRELVDLLKTAPHTQLPFNRFIPAYHHHFGRQCRVADYGFTKLIDLLEALTHTVQVMGEGNKRVVTLSHRAQVRRFTSDLLRVLKSKASKKVALSEFPSFYARVISKPWDVVDYGVCEIDDILNEVSENTVVVTDMPNGDKMIAIPKREQTPEEVERTKQFAIEVVELLKHAPQCKMLFNRFVPSYHHHFGQQCRVSDYGFTKLIELFEAIPDVVQIEDAEDGERQISLTEKEGLKVLGEQVSKLVTRGNGSLKVANISQNFSWQYGYALRPESFGCDTLLELMFKLGNYVKVTETSMGHVIIAADKAYQQHIMLLCRRIFIDQPQYRMPVTQFLQLFSQYYSKPCNLEELKKDFSHVVQFITINNEQFIELSPLECFACNLYRVMVNFSGKLNLTNFSTAYLSVIGQPCRPSQCGFSSILALLQALPCTVIIKEARHKKKFIYLNKKLFANVGMSLPTMYTSGSSYHDTDSSNESCESDSSTRIAASSSTMLQEHGKWLTQVNDNSWNQQNNLWPHDTNDHWKTLKNSNDQQNWPMLETGSEILLKSLIRTPIMHCFPPPPPKPDSPPESLDQNQWKCSLWTAPITFTYSEEDHPTNVDVPPLTLPSSWNQIISDNGTSNLLSPTKNLLPAAANPLNPRTSPYYPGKRSMVIAPHPSELPLPSMSLTPKKKSAKLAHSLTDNDDNTESSIENMSLNHPDDYSTENELENASKQLFTGKRLAAQFDQPIKS
ncbi:meiosis regulator and mRNA stability factor 1 isoform X2 [Prorops nasuta]